MADDFYVHETGAFQWEGAGSRLMRQPPRERIDTLTVYLRQLLQSDTHPAENHGCPICGRQMVLAFEYYIEIPKELDISTACSQCMISVYFKSDRIPSWAKAVSIRDLPGFVD
jgi:hypothetical protein